MELIGNSLCNGGRMKIILSRKGFDSASGGYCNPILPDGTLLSFPIPGESKTPIKYSDLQYAVKDQDGIEHEMTYDDILVQLSNGKWKKDQQCHLDPDIRKEICKRPKHWIPAFGQSKIAKDFLDRMEVEKDDVFLFFGRFRQTEFNDKGKLQYVREKPEQHIIYGYMQVGEILHNSEIEQRCIWHPHYQNGKENNLYIPAEKLSWNPELPGYGTLQYAHKRVLTKFGMGISKWQLPDFFRGLDIHVETKGASLRSSFIDAPDGQGYFQFVGRGQEFVISSFDKDIFADFYQASLEEWAYRMIIDSNWDLTLDGIYQKKLQFDFGKIAGTQTTLNGALVTDALGYVTQQYQEQGAYCRYYHKIMEYDSERCWDCPLLQGGANGMGSDCEYDEPVYEGNGVLIPSAPRDRYAYYEILMQRGILLHKDISWDRALQQNKKSKEDAKKYPFQTMSVEEMVKLVNEAPENSNGKEMTEEEMIEYDAEFGYDPEDD